MTTAAIRAFIAIELPVELQRGLSQVMTSLQKHTGDAVRWVAAAHIHLTLKFLGNVSPANLDTLMKVIQAEALRWPAFELSIGGIGAFPNKNRPRIVWAGVQAPAVLTELQRGLDHETERLGYPCEARGFSPHLTLGRVSQYANPQQVKQIADAISTTAPVEIGRLRVDALRLYRSDLQPGGPIYTALLYAPLKR